MEETVERHQSGDVFGRTFGEFVPDEHHRDTAGHSDEHESEEKLRMRRQTGDGTAEENDRQPEHQGRLDEPILDQA